MSAASVETIERSCRRRARVSRLTASHRMRRRGRRSRPAQRAASRARRPCLSTNRRWSKAARPARAVEIDADTDRRQSALVTAMIARRPLPHRRAAASRRLVAASAAPPRDAKLAHPARCWADRRRQDVIPATRSAATRAGHILPRLSRTGRTDTLRRCAAAIARATSTPSLCACATPWSPAHPTASRFSEVCRRCTAAEKANYAMVVESFRTSRTRSFDVRGAETFDRPPPGRRVS